MRGGGGKVGDGSGAHPSSSLPLSQAGAVPVVLSTSQDQDYGYFEGLFGVTSEEVRVVLAA